MASYNSHCVRWSHEETLSLLEIWSSPNVQKLFDKRDGEVYKQISKLLRSNGYYRTSVQIRSRLSNLKRGYGEEMDRRNGYGSGGKTKFRYFTEMKSVAEKMSSQKLLGLDKVKEEVTSEDSSDAYESEIEDSKSEAESVIKSNSKKDEFKTNGIATLAQDLKTLLQNEQNWDVILKVDNREFKAHKTILLARSTVFASMFQHSGNTGVIYITQISPSTFEHFLLYMYTGSVDSMSLENVFGLYSAAKNYKVDSLKLECLRYMQNSLSTENFCAFMIFCFKYHEPNLERAARHFFCENVKTIIKTPQWQKYLSDYPARANELLIKVFNA